VDKVRRGSSWSKWAAGVIAQYTTDIEQLADDIEAHATDILHLTTNEHCTTC
jgi:hypothetical protein